MQRIVFYAVFAVLLSACASQTPVALREEITDMPGIDQVRGNTSEYEGRRVRWGGDIQRVENHASATWLEIVGRPLDDKTRPIRNDVSAGRFIAIIPGFLEPSIYAKGREITVLGTVEGEERRVVDTFEYRYPTVAVDAHYLWKPIIQKRYPRRDPFWDPFWYPYGPYGWPYYHYNPRKSDN